MFNSLKISISNFYRVDSIVDYFIKSIFSCFLILYCFILIFCTQSSIEYSKKKKKKHTHGVQNTSGNADGVWSNILNSFILSNLTPLYDISCHCSNSLRKYKFEHPVSSLVSTFLKLNWHLYKSIMCNMIFLPYCHITFLIWGIVPNCFDRKIY